MEPLLSLPADQFRAALAELQLDPQREADLVRQYRRANSPLAPIYGLLDRVTGQDAGQGMQRASMVPVARPEGMSVAEAVRSGQAQFAVPQGVLDAIGALVGGIDAPGAAARGLLPAQDMPAEALGTAGVAMGAGGLLGVAPDDALGIFAGRRARTADLNALQRAEDMARAGSSRDDIWRDTGWFQGPDGQWRFEIDDSRMVMRQAAADALNNPGRPDVQTNLSGAILHQPLLGGMFRGENIPAAYDDMWGDVNIGRRPQVSGAYMPDTDAITVYAPDSVEGRDVMLHEIQHAIQNREGFARGSSPNREMSYLLTERNVRLNDLARQIEQEQQRLGLSGYRPQHPDLQPLYNEYDDLVGRSIPENVAYDRYFKAAGEAEARNVSARSRFSPERRREIPPWQTLDVNEADLILPNYLQTSSANVNPLAGLLAIMQAQEPRQ